MAINPYSKTTYYQRQGYDPRVAMWAGQMKQKRADQNMKNFGEYYNDFLDKNAFGAHDKAYLEQKQGEVEAFSNSLMDRDLSSPETTRDIFRFTSKMKQDQGLKMVDQGWEKYQTAKEARDKLQLQGTPVENLWSFDQSSQMTAGQDLGDWSVNTLDDNMSQFMDPQKRMESMVNNVMQEGMLVDPETGEGKYSKLAYQDENGKWVFQEKGIAEKTLGEILYSDEAVEAIMASPEGAQIQRIAKYKLDNGFYETMEEALEGEYDNYASNTIRERAGVSIKTKEYNAFVDKKKSKNGSNDEEDGMSYIDAPGVSQANVHFNSTESFTENKVEKVGEVEKLREQAELAEAQGDYEKAGQLDRQADILQDEVYKMDDLYKEYEDEFLATEGSEYTGLEKPDLNLNAGYNDATKPYNDQELGVIEEIIEEEMSKPTSGKVVSPVVVPGVRSNVNYTTPQNRINERLEQLQNDGVLLNIPNADKVNAIVGQYEEYNKKVEEMNESFNSWIEKGGGITDTEYTPDVLTTEGMKASKAGEYYMNNILDVNDYKVTFVGDYPTSMGINPIDTHYEDFLQGEYADDNRKFFNKIGSDKENRWNFQAVTSANKYFDGTLVATHTDSDGNEVQMRLTPKRKGIERHQGFYNQFTKTLGIIGDSMEARADYRDIPSNTQGVDLSNYSNYVGDSFDSGDMLTKVNTQRGQEAHNIQKNGKDITNSNYLATFSKERRTDIFADMLWDEIPKDTPFTRKDMEEIAAAMTISSSKDSKYLDNVITKIGEKYPDQAFSSESISGFAKQVMNKPYNFRSKHEAIDFAKRRGSEKKSQNIRNSGKNSVSSSDGDYGNSLAVRNNNPGNLRPTSGKGYRKFNSPQEGYKAMVADVSRKVNGKSRPMLAKFGMGYQYKNTLADLISVYAPSSENDPLAYANSVSKYLGVSKNTKIKDLDPEKLSEAMAFVEDKNMHRQLKDLNII